MKPRDAEATIRRAAREYASGETSPSVLWSVFQAQLRDLSLRGPLSGDFLRLFQALDLWEQSVSPDREIAEANVREAAARLG